MMKTTMFCTSIILVGAASMAVVFSTSMPDSFTPGNEHTLNGGSVEVTYEASRVLKEKNWHEPRTGRKMDYEGVSTLEDYGPIDPVPSSATVKSGTIEHGTPLIPYIPQHSPPPPAHPRQHELP